MSGAGKGLCKSASQHWPPCKSCCSQVVPAEPRRADSKPPRCVFPGRPSQAPRPPQESTVQRQAGSHLGVSGAVSQIPSSVGTPGHTKSYTPPTESPGTSPRIHSFTVSPAVLMGTSRQGPSLSVLPGRGPCWAAADWRGPERPSCLPPRSPSVPWVCPVGCVPQTGSILSEK